MLTPKGPHMRVWSLTNQWNKMKFANKKSILIESWQLTLLKCMCDKQDYVQWAGHYCT